MIVFGVLFVAVAVGELAGRATGWPLAGWLAGLAVVVLSARHILRNGAL